jgi:hypothetical protein
MQSAEYAYTDTALHAMITVTDYRAQPEFFVPHVTVEDRNLMVAELHDSDFAVLATADLDLALVRERVGERRARRSLTDADKAQFEGRRV